MKPESSLSAVHLAALELQSGRADMVLTGGIDTFNDIFMYMCFSKTPALSRSGDCRPFSDEADGTMLGEGIAMLALKRLADAERDGDHIYAVLRGVGSSSDGRHKSIYAPRSEGQAMALKVSDAAVKQVKDLKQAQNLGDDVFLRMGVKGGGCSGMSYALEFDNELGPEDREFQIDGVRVVCDKKSYLYLNETMLDYVQQGLTGGFTFVNPNAKSSCGCGSSFSA